ncbi:hypothetical protein EK21DRAFT_87450 [Setomelanomma holmii]|uniref:Uncharacterized protein n=1 Tax=Setomelanomma holmii TaxID=210430 RepID=A0A9P4LQR9_9PLEO|nr:hypothetical protein EK21DRAFT_87450 [Setomelanomma holmii]
MFGGGLKERVRARCPNRTFFSHLTAALITPQRKTTPNAHLLKFIYTRGRSRWGQADACDSVPECLSWVPIWPARPVGYPDPFAPSWVSPCGPAAHTSAPVAGDRESVAPIDSFGGQLPRIVNAFRVDARNVHDSHGDTAGSAEVGENDADVSAGHGRETGTSSFELDGTTTQTYVEELSSLHFGTLVNESDATAGETSKTFADFQSTFTEEDAAFIQERGHCVLYSRRFNHLNWEETMNEVTGVIERANVNIDAGAVAPNVDGSYDSLMIELSDMPDHLRAVKTDPEPFSEYTQFVPKETHMDVGFDGFDAEHALY